MKAIDVFCGDSRAAAGARVIVKRGLRKMRLPVPDSHEALAAIFKVSPWEFSSGIERAIEESKRAYERNDTERERQKAEDVETLMALLCVQLDWPGLYPTYTYKGRKPPMMPPGLFAAESYSLNGLWALLRDIRKYEGAK